MTVVGHRKDQASALAPAWWRRPFPRYVRRRLGSSALILLGVTLVAFLLTTVVPANPETANLGQRALSDPETVRRFREHYGLDRPLPLQYLTYLGNLLRGDFGQSQQTLRPVSQDLLQFAPATLELVLSATLVALLVGVLCGVAAARRRGGWFDRITRLASLTGVSLPIFWIALVASVVFFRGLRLLPGSGRLDPALVKPPQVTGFLTVDSLLAGDWHAFGSAVSHLVLPSAVLAVSVVGMVLRFTRTAVLEALGTDFVKAARAKGLRERDVLWGYAVRFAFGPLVTATTLSFGFLLAATVYVEQQFSWGGIGQYAYRSSTNLDLSAVMGVSIVIALIFVLINLAADLLYALFDPRIRLR
ncbi:peptide ABC transporter permease [Acrocarpospora pleiomorpha]|uniref:Peptide ABC transporter permease n=1 Tax=Acrocarpospora pleiomorpha TaxID=90975 RepID=A0A5M3XGR6_9ACTN|nr:ABC transporter permease [Acrocarpospora pleiomorpha]GES20727.1 peptide ABC transporter permease [Acrocarpospora pleiomorpha]